MNERAVSLKIYQILSMSDSNVYGLIVAGGKGERFWPASRASYPKHFLKILGKKSLLQQTFSRLKKLVPSGRIYIVTIKNQAALIKKQIPGIKNKNIILEPFGRNTAAAIGLASFFIKGKNDEAAIVSVPSDHYVGDNSGFASAVKKAVDLAKTKNRIVTLGVKPTYPATGYGYIKVDIQRPAAGKDKFYKKVERFTEKPSLNLAKKFIKNKSYFWNSGIFIFPVLVMLDNIKRYHPKLYNSLLEINKAPSKKKIAKIYSKLDNISIDYAVVEKTNQLLMLEADFKWDDLGSWDCLPRYLPADKNRNIISARHHGLATKNCIVVGERNHLIGTIGLNNILIVQTKEATLVCAKDNLEKIKTLLHNL